MPLIPRNVAVISLGGAPSPTPTPGFASEAEFVASVFQNGAVAGWVLGLDDLSSLFKANDGSANTAADSDTVGLAFSKRSMTGLSASSFLVSQPELTTNGSFSADANWTKAAGVTISGGVANFSAVSSSSALYQAGSITNNSFYRISADLTASANSIQLKLFGDTNVSPNFSSSGSVSAVRLPTSGNTNMGFATSGSFTGTVDNASVKLACATGFTQSSSSLRPKWHTGNYVTFDGSDDVLVGNANALASSSANTIMVRVTIPASIAATQVFAGLSGSSTARLYVAINTNGQLCAGVGSDATSTIVGINDVRGKTGSIILRHDGTTVKIDWVEDDQAVSHEYSAAQNGNPSTTVTFDVGALNNNGTAASSCGANLHPMAFHVQRAITDNELLQYAAFLRSK